MIQRRVRRACLKSSIVGAATVERELAAEEVREVVVVAAAAGEEEEERERGGRKLRDLLRRVRSFKQRDIWALGGDEEDIFENKMRCAFL